MKKIDLDIDFQIDNNTIKTIAMPSLMFAGGFIGGRGNYYLELISDNVEVNPQSLPFYGYLGSLSGAIGASIIIWKLKKNFFLYQIFVLAIACGLGFPLILSGIINLVSLQSQVVKLRSDVVQEQQNGINAIQNIVADSQDSYVKQEAVEQIAQIAKRSESDQVKESAIVALDTTDNDPKNFDLQLTTISNLEKIALNTDNEEVKEQIVQNILRYRGLYGDIVNDAAEKALNNIMGEHWIRTPLSEEETN